MTSPSSGSPPFGTSSTNFEPRIVLSLISPSVEVAELESVADLQHDADAVRHAAARPARRARPTSPCRPSDRRRAPRCPARVRRRRRSRPDTVCTRRRNVNRLSEKANSIAIVRTPTLIESDDDRVALAERLHRAVPRRIVGERLSVRARRLRRAMPTRSPAPQISLRQTTFRFTHLPYVVARSSACVAFGSADQRVRPARTGCGRRCRGSSASWAIVRSRPGRLSLMTFAVPSDATPRLSAARASSSPLPPSVATIASSESMTDAQLVVVLRDGLGDAGRGCRRARSRPHLGSRELR